MKHHNTNNGWTFVWASAWRNSVNATIEGVGMLFSPRFLKSLTCMEKKQSKIFCATFNSNPCTTCYCPINSHDESDITTFYDMLYLLAGHNVLIIGRNMDAQIGKEENDKFCLPNLPNRNGEYQADFHLRAVFHSKNLISIKGIETMDEYFSK